jgi:small ligand-binding sensory domain FIST
VRRTTGARAVVGCSGVGVPSEPREIEGEPAAAVLVIDDDRLVARSIAIERLTGDDLAHRIAEAAESTLAENGSLVLLPDPRGLKPSGLLAGLARPLGPVPVLGAVAAAAREPVGRQNFFHNYTGALLLIPE